MKYPKLDQQFYEQDDVVTISKNLLGKYLFTHIGGELCGGMIVETEAYNGRCDKACHAYNNKRTNRTAIMYEPGGKAYVYLCYGIHYLFNITTNVADKADAVLVRAIEPVVGLETIQQRRNITSVVPRLTAGPGVVSQALGISREQYGEPLSGDVIWIEDRNVHLPEDKIVSGKRIGVDYAGEDALLPWRFFIKDNKWVSNTKKSKKINNVTSNYST